MKKYEIPPISTRLRKYGTYVLTITLIIVFYKLFFEKIFNFLISQIESNAKSNNIFSIGMFCIIVMTLNIFPFPGLVYFCVLMSFFMDNFVKSFLIIYISCIIICVSVFVVIKLWLQKIFTARLKHLMIYRIFNSECKKGPWTVSILSNILALPACTPTIILPITDVNLITFLIPKLIFQVFFSVLYVLLGQQIGELNSAVGGGDEEGKETKGFFDKSPLEWVNFVVSTSITLISIVVFVYFGIVSNRKFKEFREYDLNVELIQSYEEELKKDEEGKRMSNQGRSIDYKIKILKKNFKIEEEEDESKDQK